LKHCVRTVDKHGQVKLHHHVFYVDEGLQKEKVDIFIYSECLRVEFEGQVIVEYSCRYDKQKKKVTRIDTSAVWWVLSQSKQMVLFSREIYRIMFASLTDDFVLRFITAVARRRQRKRGIDDTTQMFLKFEPAIYTP